MRGSKRLVRAIASAAAAAALAIGGVAWGATTVSSTAQGNSWNTAPEGASLAAGNSWNSGNSWN